MGGDEPTRKAKKSREEAAVTGMTKNVINDMSNSKDTGYKNKWKRF